MIDTLRLNIYLSQKQFDRIREVAYKSEREQPGYFSPQTGEIRLRRVEGLIKTDQNSFHREIRWELPPSYHPPNEARDKRTGRVLHRLYRTFLTVELSLPKLWYGHNIHLLHNFKDALVLLKQLLEEQFSLKRSPLPDLNEWQVSRVDCCYAWRFPSQVMAQQVLDSLKHLHFPRKKPYIRDTSISFVGATYTVKFYLKLPEFCAHDKKALLKDKASPEWVEHLEGKAAGVLRYEATLRPKYLKRVQVRTVRELVEPVTYAEWGEESELQGFNPYFAIQAIMTHLVCQGGMAPGTELKSGQNYTAPAGCRIITQHGEYEHLGGGFTYFSKERPATILRYFLSKFLGNEPAMRTVDQVRAKLLETYKPNKAFRLVSFWLFVQKFGTEEAKRLIGRNPYYTARSDLKKAGVYLVEPPRLVTSVDRDFVQSFRFEVPSNHATNLVDDFRGSDNLLNLTRAFNDEVERRWENDDLEVD